MLHIAVESLSISGRHLSGPMDIKVPSGGLHRLKGPNGCGKSLLLDVVTGLTKAKGVHSDLDGKALHRLSALDRWRMGLRRLFQSPVLPAGAFVDEALSWHSAPRAKPYLVHGVSELLADAGVLSRHQLGRLSFGQRRCVELCCVLSQGGGLLLDEPFVGLAPSLVSRATALVHEACRRGSTILVVDHQTAGAQLRFDASHEWVAPAQFSNGAAAPIIAVQESVQPSEVSWAIDAFALPDRVVLRDVTLVLPRGGLLVIDGGNGSGKSTLLRALASHRQPFEGVTARLAAKAYAADILLSPQPPKLVPELSVAANLRLMLGRGLPVKPVDWVTAVSALAWFGIGDAALRSRAELLSGGEAAAVALVGALLSSAPIVFLDEPFESLSRDAAAKGLRLLLFARNAGKCVVAVSHYPLLECTLGARLHLGDSDYRNTTVYGLAPNRTTEEGIQ